MKYRKKPVVVEAFATEEPMDIETLEGVMHASAGDYIITGVEGERYPCKPDIFKKTYEPADAEPLSVDRDALLALAKVLGGMGDRYNEHERYELGTTFKAIADRIREACGVTADV